MATARAATVRYGPRPKAPYGWASALRLQVFSDLHADFNKWPPAPDLSAHADAVIVAGDVCEGIALGFEYLRASVPDSIPIVMVAGNHEFYRSSIEREFAQARDAARTYAVTFLENSAAEIDGVRFIGATLWTDYALFGEANRSLAMAIAEDRLMDHRLIRAESGLSVRFRPDDARELHFESRRFLERALAIPFDGPTVVVTHHGVHEKSVDRRYAANLLTAAFVSDLSDLLAFEPALWVHGHTHTRFDYRVGLTRVICNPRGYGGENPAFEPGFIVEV